ncbi:MAG: hypothetical protein ABIG30_02290 [Candidatus Aenigmatarchaeota archaeon]
MAIDLITIFLSVIKLVMETAVNAHPVVMFAIFAVFVFVAVKVFSMVVRAAIVAAIGAGFPFFMNYLFNAGIAITLNTVIFFASSAVGLFMVYRIAKFVYKILSGFSGLLGSDEKIVEVPTPIMEEED